MKSAGTDIVRLVLLVLASMMLTGCFDIAAKLTLNSDGSGNVAVRIVYTREATALILANKKPPPTSNANDAVKREFFVQDGQAIQQETTTFKSLDQLAFRDQQIDVANLGSTTLGAKRDRVTWTLLMAGSSKNGPPPPLFAGRVFEVAMDLPCTIETAGDAAFPGATVQATVGSFFVGSGGSVSWQVPLPVLMSLPPGRHAITFQIECWSWSGMKSGMTRFGVAGPGSAPPAAPQQPAPPQPSVAGPSTTPPTAQQFVLDRFPLLSQVDRSNYAPGSTLYDEWDTVSSSSDPTLSRPVWKLACLATVYAMLERGSGGNNAAIDNFYRLGKEGGGYAANLTNLSVEGRDKERTIDPEQIGSAIQSGMPVILHGTGGALGHHFVLVVGVVTDGRAVRQLIINDPWPLGGTGAPQQNRVAASNVIDYPYAGVVFDKMRLVTRKDVYAEGLSSQYLRIDGIGPLTIGMTVAESAAAGVGLNEPERPSSMNGGCTYARPVADTPGLSLMLNDRRVVRVDINPPTRVRSTLDVGIGSSESEVLDAAKKIGAQVEVDVHKYVVGGHYLIVSTPESRNRNLAFVFETDGQRVTRFRSGLLPPVRWVEGCL